MYYFKNVVNVCVMLSELYCFNRLLLLQILDAETLNALHYYPMYDPVQAKGIDVWIVQNICIFLRQF